MITFRVDRDGDTGCLIIQAVNFKQCNEMKSPNYYGKWIHHQRETFGRSSRSNSLTLWFHALNQVEVFAERLCQTIRLRLDSKRDIPRSADDPADDNGVWRSNSPIVAVIPYNTKTDKDPRDRQTGAVKSVDRYFGTYGCR